MIGRQRIKPIDLLTKKEIEKLKRLSDKYRKAFKKSLENFFKSMWRTEIIARSNNMGRLSDMFEEFHWDIAGGMIEKLGLEGYSRYILMDLAINGPSYPYELRTKRLPKFLERLRELKGTPNPSKLGRDNSTEAKGPSPDTLLKSLRKLERRGLIELWKVEPSPHGAGQKKIYRLTVRGFHYSLGGYWAESPFSCSGILLGELPTIFDNNRHLLEDENLRVLDLTLKKLMNYDVNLYETAIEIFMIALIYTLIGDLLFGIQNPSLSTIERFIFPNLPTGTFLSRGFFMKKWLKILGGIPEMRALAYNLLEKYEKHGIIGSNKAKKFRKWLGIKRV